MVVFLLRSLSRLSHGALQGLSTGLSWLLGRVIGYRREVILGNLRRSFPGLTADEHTRLYHAFMRHFADITVESIKHFSIDREDAHARMTHLKTEVFDPFFAARRSVLIAGGHMNNWERYALTADAAIPHKTMAIYKRLSNPAMDEAMRSSRERFGLKMVPTREAKQWVADHIDDPIAVVMGFDQSPADPAKSWWTTFLHQETAWYFGLEQFARTHDMPVIYGHIRKRSRGWYETEYELVTDDPRALPAGDILRRCIDLLEQDILDAPSEWLWSHKRWKHKRPADQPLHPRASTKGAEA